MITDGMEPFERRLHEMEITPEMAKECALRLIAGAFHRTDNRPRFSIPTRHDDDDVVIIEFIKRVSNQQSDSYRRGMDDAERAVTGQFSAFVDYEDDYSRGYEKGVEAALSAIRALGEKK